LWKGWTVILYILPIPSLSSIWGTLLLCLRFAPEDFISGKRLGCYKNLKARASSRSMISHPLSSSLATKILAHRWGTRKKKKKKKKRDADYQLLVTSPQSSTPHILENDITTSPTFSS
jgi:hypothetical protein